MHSRVQIVRAAWLAARRAGLRRSLYRIERRVRLRCLDPCLAPQLYPRHKQEPHPAPADGAQRPLLAELAALRLASPIGSAWDREAGTIALLNQPLFPLAAPVRWHEPPLADPLWAFQLHGWEWAWSMLADPAAHEVLSPLLRDWLAQVPVGRGLAWEPHPTSRRLTVWAAAWHLHGDDGEFLGAIGQHAAYLADHLERDLDNNHLLANAKALAWAGLLCPGLPRSERWRRLGLGLLWEALAAQTRGDGGHVENSTSYHLAAWLDGLETALLADACSEAVPATAWACLARMATFARALQRPDGRLPLLNDSIEDEPLLAQTLFDLAQRTLDLSAPDDPMQGSSRAMKESGYVVLRSGPGRRDTYLVFDAGQLGPAHCPGHGHADALSFELWSRGEPLVVDPGTYQYPAGPWRDYFRGTAAHSTAIVDGLDQSTFAGPFRVAHMAHATLLEANLDGEQQTVVGEHDGYTRLPDPVIQRRRIRLLGHDELAIEDTFVGHAQHQLALHFHLAPCQATLQEAAAATAAYPGGTRLALQVTCTEPGTLAIEQGWTSSTWYRKESTPVLSYQCQAKLPITIITRLRIA